MTRPYTILVFPLNVPIIFYIINNGRKKSIIYIEHIYDYRINQFYNFEEQQNLYDKSDNDFLKYYRIVNNIYEDWKALLKERTHLHRNQISKQNIYYI